MQPVRITMHLPFRLSLFLAAASLASAQTIPPPASDATDTPVMLENVIVTASGKRVGTSDIHRGPNELTWPHYD